jgi:hypothetical protein
MDVRRRLFLAAFVPGAMFAGASFTGLGSPLAPAAQAQNPRTVPPAPNQPPLLSPAAPPTSAQLRQNQRDIRKDVDQLFSLAQELKALAAKSDAAQELSVGLIQKTEEIEKLAKKIRDLARS